MVLVKEYRVVMNCTLEDYNIGQLYAVAQASKAETGGGEGVEIEKNEPYTDKNGVTGQYTCKIYHLESKVPAILRAILPASAMILKEEAWNAYPHCLTILTSKYMGDKFKLITESQYVANDRGNLENALNLDKDTLKKRVIDKMDIANENVDAKDYKAAEDPKLFQSKKDSQRGPLNTQDWQKSCTPVMCCYKLVTAEFIWWGLQGKVEKFIQSTLRRLLLKFNRQLFCSTDEWLGLTIQDIRKIEETTANELDDMRMNTTASNGTAIE
ncbi:phosphatidylinositol transfer protein [Ramicandelaber brevisporus]|nr:phosphatidylinositol transfer protein [Ramicandelaber brevisporus]